MTGPDVTATAAGHRPVSPLHVEVTTATVVVHLHLSDETANALYNELVHLQRSCGWPESGWRDRYSGLFDVYDALAGVGVDGTR